MDKLKAMATFVRIVDSGSLTAAADATGQSTASVVRSLAALEKHLGVRLLNRNTRRLALTDEGTEFLAWSRRMLAEFDDFEHRLDVRRHEPGGLLRMTAPVEFGHRHVAPIINEFLRRHPAMRVELILVDRIVDLLEEGLDLAIRIGNLPDSAMVALPLGRTRPVVCASPDYLASAGPVDHPSALPTHACIAFLPQGCDWQFREAPGSAARHRGAAGQTGPEPRALPASGAPVDTAVVARLASNQVQAVRLAGQQGLGIVRLFHYQVAEELADGRLVRLLSAFEPPDISIQMVYPHARLLSPRVRQLIDWAAPRLRASIPDPVAVPAPRRPRRHRLN